MKEIFTKNLSLKFLSLLLAISLWVYVATVENRTDVFPGEIPIETKDLAPSLAAVYDNDLAKVKISAPSSIWKKLVADDFVAYVDLGNLSIGTHQVPVKVTCSEPGVQIVEVDPAEIRVRIETAVTSEVNVGVKFEGQLAAGYEVIETKVNPTKVEAKAAKAVIESLTQATAVVKLNGSDRDINQKIKLTAFDEFDKPIKFVTFTPERVEVTVIIANQGGGKIVGIKPKLVGSPASGYWISNITIDPSTIRIVASEEILKNIEYLETKEINIAGINRNQEWQVPLILPNGVTLSAGESNSIEVKITISLNSQSREVIAGFSYSGLGAGLSVSGISPNIVKVIVSGPANVLSSLSSDNVVINLDLSGKAAGSHLISIEKSSISVPNGAAISSFVPNNVTVTIQ